ncbi:diphthine synthase [Nanoarchaeota archaeon]
MLYLIGLGLDKKDISLGAKEVLKKCKKVYLESYTNVFPYSVKELEDVLKKKVIKANRNMVEEKTPFIEEAKKQKVALLVSGDPLSATTHIDLLMRCKKEGVEVKIFHAPSILTAVAETGLQLYKFGKTGSIARWQPPSFKPTSFFDIVKQNLESGAHTLLLLDIGLSVKEALSYLDSIARTKEEWLLDYQLIVCSGMGTDKQKISVGPIDVLSSRKFVLPACIVVPGQLHFVEKEMLDSLRKE